MSNIIGFNGGLFTTSHISAKTELQINNNAVISSSALGDSIKSSKLTSLGTIIDLKATNGTIDTLSVGVLNTSNTNISNISGNSIVYTSGTIPTLTTTRLLATNGTTTNFNINNSTIGALYSDTIDTNEFNASDGIFETLETTSGTANSMSITSCTTGNLYTSNININNSTTNNMKTTNGTISSLYSTALNATNGTIASLYMTNGTASNMVLSSCTASSLSVGSIMITGGTLNIATNQMTNLSATNATITNSTLTNQTTTNATIGSLISNNIDATVGAFNTLDIVTGTLSNLLVSSCTVGRLISTTSISCGINPMTAGSLTISSLVSGGLISNGTNSMTTGALSVSSIVSNGLINNGTNSMTTGALTTRSIVSGGLITAGTNPITCGALNTTSIVSSGIISCGTNSMTSGALNTTGIVSSGSISCGTNSMTCGSLNTTSIVSSGLINTGTNSLISGAINCGGIISTGGFTNASNPMTTGLLNTTGIQSLGIINNGTNSMTTGALSVSSIQSSGIINNGTNSMTTGALSVSSIQSTGAFNNGTNSMTSGSISSNIVSSNNINGNSLYSGISTSRRYPPDSVTYILISSTSTLYVFRIAPTTSGNFYGNGTYYISTGCTYNNQTTLPNLVDSGSNTSWQGSSNASTQNDYTSGIFNITSGSNSVTSLIVGGKSYYGIWLKYQLPCMINLTGVRFLSNTTNIPSIFYIFGSHDNTNYTLLYDNTLSPLTGLSSSIINTIAISTIGYYCIFMIMFNQLSTGSFVGFTDFNLLGTEAGLVSLTNSTYSKQYTVISTLNDNIDVGLLNDNNGSTWYGLGKSIDSGIEGMVQLAGYSGIAFKTATPTTQPAMIISSSGNVGIGTTNPYFPMVITSAGRSLATYLELQGNNLDTNTIGRLRYNDGYSNIPFRSTETIALQVNNGIQTGIGIYVTSDQRIKTNIIEADTSIVLDKLMQLPLMTYNYIDHVESGIEKVYGMIAQKVEKVLPEAITIIKHTIPSIYKFATNIQLSGDNIIISVDIPETSELKVNGIVELIIEGKNEKYQTKLISFTSDELVVPKWTDFDKTKKIFVYGSEVDDFHVLDKPYMGVFCMGGIQELNKRNDTLKTKITLLEEKITQQDQKIQSLQQQMTTVLLHLNINQ